MDLFKFCKNYSIKTKIASVMGLILIGAVAFGLFAMLQVSQVNTNSADIRDDWLPGTRALGDLRYYVTRFRSAEGSYLLSNKGAQQDKQMQRLAPIAAKADSAIGQYERLVSPGRERELFDKLAAAWHAYRPMLDRVAQINDEQGRDAAAAYFMGPMRSAFDKLNAALDDGIAYNNDGGVFAGNRSQHTFESARTLIIVLLVGAVLFCVAATWALITCVSTPIMRITGAMGELAQGHLDTHVPHADQADEVGQLAASMTAFKNQLAEAERSKAEQTRLIVSSVGAGLDHLARGDLRHRIFESLTGPFAKLKDDFNKAMEQLQDTMKHVLASTGQIASGSGEISQAADDLAHRTEQQAASLEETAAALEQITATMKKTAANSREVDKAISAANVEAKEGGRVVDTATRAMDSISQSSKQITDIIGVIDEIAFQTNLLALNAGVEAARAGEAGKGFAVVASEVRALAGRSGEAAKQIKSLIHASGEYVANGVKLVGESGQALKRIVDQVQQINALVSEMAGAAEQQSTGIQQVNSAVGQMDQVTQQNAAMVEQSTAASRNLANETQALAQLVSFFQVGEEAAPAVRERAAAKAPVARAVRRTAVAAARKPQEATEEWSEF